MKAKLSIINRVSLLGLLINEGDATTLKILRTLREELSFTEEEHAELKMIALPNGKMSYDEKAVPEKEFVFEGVREILIEKVKTQLRTLEEKGTLLLDYLPLYEALIEKPGALRLVKEEDEEIKKELGFKEDEEQEKVFDE